MAKNFAQKLKTPALVAWKQDGLTNHSQKYKQAAVELAMKYFRGKPCVFCGGMDTPDSVGHHIYIRSRNKGLVSFPENIIPLCSKHHTSWGSFCAHSLNDNTMSVGKFWQALEQNMPDRMAAILKESRRLEEDGVKHDFKSDFEFWVGVWEEKQEYEYVCQQLGIEAWPEELS